MSQPQEKKAFLSILDNKSGEYRALLKEAYRVTTFEEAAIFSQSLLDRFSFSPNTFIHFFSLNAIAGVSVSSRAIGGHPELVDFEDLASMIFKMNYNTTGPIILLDVSQIMFPGNEEFFKPSISAADFLDMRAVILGMIESNETYPPSFYEHWGEIIEGKLPYGVTIRAEPEDIEDAPEALDDIEAADDDDDDEEEEIALEEARTEMERQEDRDFVEHVAQVSRDQQRQNDLLTSLGINREIAGLREDNDDEPGVLATSSTIPLNPNSSELRSLRAMIERYRMVETAPEQISVDVRIGETGGHNMAGDVQRAEIAPTISHMYSTQLQAEYTISSTLGMQSLTGPSGLTYRVGDIVDRDSPDIMALVEAGLIQVVVRLVPQRIVRPTEW